MTRRGSFAPAPTSSDARTQLLAATATGTTDEPADVADPATPPPRPTYGDRAAVVLRLKAQHTARGAAADKPPPRYHGTADRPETQRNAATFAERKAAEACFGCTPAQLAAQGDVPHWQCRHHGQDASAADRVTRVAGSGPQRLSPRRARPALVGPTTGARCLGGSLRGRQGLRLDGRLSGGLACQPGDFDRHAHVPRVGAKQPNVQAPTVGVPLDRAGPAARHSPARHRCDALLHLRPPRSLQPSGQAGPTSVSTATAGGELGLAAQCCFTSSWAIRSAR